MSEVDKKAGQVRRMFGAIAPRYDLLNRLLSLSIDRYWRRVARRKLEEVQAFRGAILDLCTGTGDLAFEMTHLGSVVGCDFSHPMLVLGTRKQRQRNGTVRFIEGDALRLPLPDQLFDAVTIAFGLRNLEDLQVGLEEMARVMKGGATLLILEFSIPTVPIFRGLYLFYFTRILPLIGHLVSGRKGPYSYLPASVREFPAPPALAKVIGDCGFDDVTVESLTGGIACLYLARKKSL